MTCQCFQGGSMPNTSSSVPYLLSSSMQSIRSRRPSAVLGGSQGSGLLQQLGSGMVRLTSSHQPNNGRTFSSSTVRKCPSLNITFSWTYVRMTIVIHSSLHISLWFEPIKWCFLWAKRFNNNLKTDNVYIRYKIQECIAYGSQWL